MRAKTAIAAFEIVDDRVAEVLRQKTPAQRIAIADGLWTMASQIVRGAVMRQHPDWPEPAIGREVARRMSHGAF